MRIGIIHQGGKMKKTKPYDTGKTVRLAILAAIVIIMAFTPLGYLRTPVLEITFLMIPVAIAAIIIGPSGGAIIGGVFGATSFIQCFGISWFGTMLLGINPVFTFILCIVPRILAGWLPGLLYKTLCNKTGKTVSAITASLAAPLLNTVLFVLGLFMMFGRTEFIKGFGDTTWAIIVVLVGINGLIEAGVGFIAGSAVSRVLVQFLPDEKQNAERIK